MIRLEYFDRNDFQQLIEWVKDEQLLTNWSGSLFSFPLSEGALEWYIEDSNSLGTSDVFVYKAVDTKTGLTVGHISLGSISETNRSARISRVLVGNTAERGKGICQKMIKAVLRVGFEELKLHRITLGVYDFNESALRCYEKAGMKREGVLRDVLRHGDEYWSLVEMSMLEDEWRALHPPKPPEEAPVA
ncbi:GNAT family N-acetyltransferase [Hymenobacter sp. BT175]|uniref:GNAT family N-acetyltransferase n=1 Tax=Hymenobacter translucens TaxID=2886507 RepID=UPI001D0E5341|nr:GNAT family protein [Hymenobacter translucens]MCC2546321.1 GNAT family N-acetyltransferase [Hymenobacter translucens]